MMQYIKYSQSSFKEIHRVIITIILVGGTEFATLALAKHIF